MPQLNRIPRLLAVVLGASLLAACQQPTQAPPAQSKPAAQRQVAIPVSEQTATSGPIAAVLTYSGNVSSRATVNVLPRATGRIEQLNVDIGSEVKAGDTIATLDRRSSMPRCDKRRARCRARNPGSRSCRRAPAPKTCRPRRRP